MLTTPNNHNEAEADALRSTTTIQALLLAACLIPTLALLWLSTRPLLAWGLVALLTAGLAWARATTPEPEAPAVALWRPVGAWGGEVSPVTK